MCVCQARKKLPPEERAPGLHVQVKERKNGGNSLAGSSLWANRVLHKASEHLAKENSNFRESRHFSERESRTEKSEKQRHHCVAHCHWDLCSDLFRGIFAQRDALHESRPLHRAGSKSPHSETLEREKAFRSERSGLQCAIRKWCYISLTRTSAGTHTGLRTVTVMERHANQQRNKVFAAVLFRTGFERISNTTCKHNSKAAVSVNSKKWFE